MGEIDLSFRDDESNDGIDESNDGIDESNDGIDESNDGIYESNESSNSSCALNKIYMFSLLDLSMHGYCRVYIEQKNYKIILI
jgi:hypothetical protein